MSDGERTQVEASKSNQTHPNHDNTSLENLAAKIYESPQESTAIGLFLLLTTYVLGSLIYVKAADPGVAGAIITGIITLLTTNVLQSSARNGGGQK